MRASCHYAARRFVELLLPQSYIKDCEVRAAVPQMPHNLSHLVGSNHFEAEIQEGQLT